MLGIEAEVLARATNLVTGDSALNAPASFGGVEFYPDFATKVGVLGYRLARNHALPDGNKRSALLAMIEFAERNGRRWKILDEDETVETMVQVAAGTMSEEAFIRCGVRSPGGTMRPVRSEHLGFGPPRGKSCAE